MNPKILIFSVLLIGVLISSGCVKDEIICECIETCSCSVPDNDLLNSIKENCDVKYEELVEPLIIEKECCHSGYQYNLTTKGIINPKNESERTRCSKMVLYVDEFGNDVLCRCSWV